MGADNNFIDKITPLVNQRSELIIEMEKLFMEADKYYTPNKEDLFLGYECEIYDLHRDKWDKCTLTESDMLNEIEDIFIAINQKHLRTKYLDAEDLKELFLNKSIPSESLHEIWGNGIRITIPFYDSYYKAIYDFESKELNIEKIDIVFDPTKPTHECKMIFVGTCPSKNELRKIMSYVGIN